MRITDKRRIEDLISDKMDARMQDLTAKVHADRDITQVEQNLVSRLEGIVKDLQDRGFLIHINRHYNGQADTIQANPGPEHRITQARRKLLDKARREVNQLKEKLVIELYADEVDGAALVDRFIEHIDKLEV